jgi:hypothetical protein
MRVAVQVAELGRERGVSGVVRSKIQVCPVV